MQHGILVFVLYDAASTLRSHNVKTLDDRVRLIRKLIWWGESAFDRSVPETQSGGIRDPRLRELGLAITRGCRARDDLCELKAIYTFVKTNVRYTGDIAMKDTFQSAWRSLQMGGGDCLPLSTLVLCLNRNRAEGTFLPISAIEEGDFVMADGDWTRVEKSWFTGRKQILVFELSNHTTLRCSPEHRLLLLDNTECRAARIEVGHLLLTPRQPISLGYGNVIPVSPDGVRVIAIRAEKHAELCMDITTEAGRFWLPESDTIVHNCDDHVSVTSVLCAENGFQTRARITSNECTTWDHIFCLAGVPKNNPSRWIVLDTTLPGERFGQQPPQCKHRDFNLDPINR